MSGWIFASGHADQKTLPDITAAGATTINITPHNFIVGRQLFISEADGSETQWLGRVTAASTNSISFSRPLEKSKNSGALLWRPTAVLETPATAVFPERRMLDGGVIMERSRGGDWFAVKVAEPREALTLTLDGLTPAAELALIEWLHDHTGWGLNTFTLIDPSSHLLVARLQSGNDQPIKRERLDGGRARLTLPLWIVGEGVYQ